MKIWGRGKFWEKIFSGFCGTDVKFDLTRFGEGLWKLGKDLTSSELEGIPRIAVKSSGRMAGGLQ